VSIASARDEIRRRRKLVPVGADPLKGPWRILSTGGDYSHELHLNTDCEVTCSTCQSRHGRRTCWATARVLESLGQGGHSPGNNPEPGVGSLSWRQLHDEVTSAKRRPGPA